MKPYNACVAVASGVEFHNGQTLLGVAVASILVDAEGRELTRATRYFGREIEVGGAPMPATASAAELVAVALALEIAPPEGPLTIRTRSEFAATVLANRRGDAAYPVLESYVRVALESRGARLEYTLGGADPATTSADSLAREALARGDANFAVPAGSSLEQGRSA